MPSTSSQTLAESAAMTFEVINDEDLDLDVDITDEQANDEDSMDLNEMLEQLASGHFSKNASEGGANFSDDD